MFNSLEPEYLNVLPLIYYYNTILMENSLLKVVFGCLTFWQKPVRFCCILKNSSWFVTGPRRSTSSYQFSQPDLALDRTIVCFLHFFSLSSMTQEPKLLKFTPWQGPLAGGTRLTIHGEFLDAGSSVNVKINKTQNCNISMWVCSQRFIFYWYIIRDNDTLMSWFVLIHQH